MLIECTKGVWEVEVTKFCNVFIKSHEGNKNSLIADITTANDDFVGNAELIVSAVNACISVNEQNPLAVASGIKDVVEALKEIKEYVIGLDAMGPETGQVIAGKCYLALAKINTVNTP